MLEKVGISHLEAENPRNLSGGEARRVAIARSLIAGPSILIADEPTGDLDPATTDEVLRLFSDAHAAGVAIIIVTHERRIPASATKHFAMENGRMSQLEKYVLTKDT